MFGMWDSCGRDEFWHGAACGGQEIMRGKYVQDMSQAAKPARPISGTAGVIV
jgi:hypothetical protein